MRTLLRQRAFSWWNVHDELVIAESHLEGILVEKFSEHLGYNFNMEKWSFGLQHLKKSHIFVHPPKCLWSPLKLSGYNWSPIVGHLWLTCEEKLNEQLKLTEVLTSNES